MPSRLAAPLALVVLAVVGMAGCGSSSVETGGSRTGTVSVEATVPGPDKGRIGAPAGTRAKTCNSYATTGELRATGISCDQARQVMYGWQRQGSCVLPSSASRGGCLTHSYRCQATRTDRGTAVSCARAGASIAFLVRRG